MMSSFLAFGVTKRLAKQKLRRRNFEIFRVGLTVITQLASPSASKKRSPSINASINVVGSEAHVIL